MKKIFFLTLIIFATQISSAQEQTCAEQRTCTPPFCTPACKDAVSISKEVPSDWASSFYKADFNNDGKEDLLFVCTENNKLYLKFADNYKKVKLLQELEFADPLPFENANYLENAGYVILSSESRDFEGDKLRILQIRASRMSPRNSRTKPSAYVLLRNAELHKIIYGYNVDIYKLQKEDDGIIYEDSFMSKDLKPEFNSVYKEWSLVLVYENEFSPVRIRLPATKERKDITHTEISDVFGDSSKKLQKIYLWEKKGLKEIYSR